MERCAHTEGLNNYFKSQEYMEAQAEKELEWFRGVLENDLILVASKFRETAKRANIDTDVLKETIIEDLRNML